MKTDLVILRNPIIKVCFAFSCSLFNFLKLNSNKIQTLLHLYKVGGSVYVKNHTNY